MLFFLKYCSKSLFGFLAFFVVYCFSSLITLHINEIFINKIKTSLHRKMPKKHGLGSADFS